MNITNNCVNGSGNHADNNIGWDSAGVLQSTDSGCPGTIAGTNNVHIDPQLTKLDPLNAANNDFHPQNPAAKAYGKYAP